MEPFATEDDYAERYPDDAVSGSRLRTLLEDAAAFLAGSLAASGVEPDLGDEVAARNLLSVNCAIVHRRVSVPDELMGFSQASTTAGPFSQSGTVANPTEDMYLTASEKRLLGIAGRGRRGRMLSVRPELHPWGARADGG